MIIRKTSGGYYEAIFDVPTADFEAGGVSFIVERIFGDSASELIDRIKMRFPKLKIPFELYIERTAEK